MSDSIRPDERRRISLQDTMIITSTRQASRLVLILGGERGLDLQAPNPDGNPNPKDQAEPKEGLDIYAI